MRIRTTMTAAAICALLMAANGCGKKEEAPPVVAPQASPASDAAREAVQKAVATAEAQTKVVKQAVESTVTNVQGQAAAATSDKAQGVIDNVKKLISESKWSEALTMLNGLGGQQLTPEQQTLVQTLKEQVQKAIQASGATKAAEGLLPPGK